MYEYKGTKINTEPDYMGYWMATTENYDAECIDGTWVSDHPVGEGLTEQEAVDDLIEILKETE